MGEEVEFDGDAALKGFLDRAKKPKGLNVHVTVTPEGYVASWGIGFTSNPPAKSASTALRLLATQLETAGLHGAIDETLSDIALNPHAACKYCYAPIFFAHLPHPSEKFLAFDTQPLDATQAKGLRVAVFSKVVDQRGRPVVAWALRPTGPVWIPHPECCGERTEPPENEYLARRWEPRHTIHMRQRDQVIDRLRNVLHEVNQGALDG